MPSPAMWRRQTGVVYFDSSKHFSKWEHTGGKVNPNM